MDEFRVVLVVLEKPVSVLAHLEEVGWFLDQLNFVARWGDPADNVALVVFEDFLQLGFSEVFFVFN